jgi:hypothetical protein
MSLTAHLAHEFVTAIPESLEESVLYISIPYATAAHLCACGCGREVVTPITPTDWELTFDGESVSLHPSVGNWSFPCQSHYVIKRGRVQWAPRLTREQIQRGRERDRMRKTRYAELRDAGEKPVDSPSERVAPRGVFARLRALFDRASQTRGAG